MDAVPGHVLDQLRANWGSYCFLTVSVPYFVERGTPLSLRGS
jgi:hypothetical protein